MTSARYTVVGTVFVATGGGPQRPFHLTKLALGTRVRIESIDYPPNRTPRAHVVDSSGRKGTCAPSALLKLSERC